MGLDADTTAPITAPDAQPEQAPETTPPASADARAKAAERARKHRALKKLKGAKSEKQLKELAAEVAAPEAPEAPSWPTRGEIEKAAAEIAPLIVEHVVPELDGTPFALTERKVQILVLSLAPAAAQAAKAEAIGTAGKYVPPWLVALGGLAIVFGPPAYRELRAMFDGAPSPAPKVPDAAP